MAITPLNRRGFLGAIAGAIAGATLDPEKLLWVPRKKLISIPKPGAPLLVKAYSVWREASWNPLRDRTQQDFFESALCHAWIIS